MSRIKIEWKTTMLNTKFRVFGKIEIITKTGKQRKLNNKESNTIMIEYDTEKDISVYRIFNISTERIYRTKNVDWLGMRYSEYTRNIL